MGTWRARHRGERVSVSEPRCEGSYPPRAPIRLTSQRPCGLSEAHTRNDTVEGPRPHQPKRRWLHGGTPAAHPPKRTQTNNRPKSDGTSQSHSCCVWGLLCGGFWGGGKGMWHNGLR